MHSMLKKLNCQVGAGVFPISIALIAVVLASVFTAFTIWGDGEDLGKAQASGARIIVNTLTQAAVQKRVADLHDKLKTKLREKSDNGALVDVQIYKTPEGQYLLHSVSIIGYGKSPRQAIKTLLKTGAISPPPPPGILIDQEMSTLYWFTLGPQGTLVREQVMNRQLEYRKAKEELKAEVKKQK